MLAGGLSGCSALLTTLRPSYPAGKTLADLCRRSCQGCTNDLPDWSFVDEVWIRGDLHVVSR